ncbi:MAG: DUF305 domain-containing protein [Candidatus Peribacteraceae bacterium]|nr:DUF305 domain-containing protein [Candidatus Peribacteraceae bacterium]
MHTYFKRSLAFFFPLFLALPIAASAADPEDATMPMTGTGFWTMPFLQMPDFDAMDMMQWMRDTGSGSMTDWMHETESGSLQMPDWMRETGSGSLDNWTWETGTGSLDDWRWGTGTGSLSDWMRDTGSGSTQPAYRATGTGSLDSLTGDDFDAAFLNQMADHHRGSVAMARLARNRASHTELRDFAQAIVTNQRAEIAQMEDWSDARGYDMDMTGMNGSEDAVRELRGLRGEEFDRAFLMHMIPHHQDAVAMAQMALDRSAHEEVKEMAREIITDQREEVDRMRGWQETWGYEEE